MKKITLFIFLSIKLNLSVGQVFVKPYDTMTPQRLFMEKTDSCLIIRYEDPAEKKKKLSIQSAAEYSNIIKYYNDKIVLETAENQTKIEVRYCPETDTLTIKEVTANKNEYDKIYYANKMDHIDYLVIGDFNFIKNYFLFKTKALYLSSKSMSIRIGYYYNSKTFPCDASDLNFKESGTQYNNFTKKTNEIYTYIYKFELYFKNKKRKNKCKVHYCFKPKYLELYKGKFKHIIY